MACLGIADMNWKRGLLRLWIGLSTAWITLCLVNVFVIKARFDDFSVTEFLPTFVLYAFLPPIALLGAGYLVAWIGRGFRQ